MTGWSMERGATVLPDGSTRFTVWAPRARSVSVRLDDDGRHPLRREDDGVFEGVVPGVAAGTDYFYRLDGERDRPDPVSRHQPEGVHGPSRAVDPSAYEWSDADWRGIETPDLILYELHVGTFTETGDFGGVVEQLGALRDLGVTAIELMPVAEFPGSRNWGYDGTCLYAPESSYGGPDGLRRLVDAAHAAGLAVVLDVVYNHLGPEGNYLPEFGPYFTDRYVTPWGQAVNFDGPGSDQVRQYVIDNALHWISEYHIDGLRLDAVHAIFDRSARHILEEIAAVVGARGDELGRHMHVIAESDLNDPRLVRSVEHGGYGLDAQWSDDFHHAVHAALTGEANGYYVDFGGVGPVVKAFKDRFVLDGSYSAFRERRHGAPASDVPRERFVIFIQNHDQVGNRARGDRIGSLLSVEAQKLAAALVLLSPYVPLLFMGEEYGETRPFLYFVDHGDLDLVEAVREGREREFERFDWGQSIPEPGARDTFARSRLDRSVSEAPPHLDIRRLYEDLLDVRGREAALRPGDSEVRVAHGGGDTLAVLYEHPEATDLLALFNLGEAAAELRVPARDWKLKIATDDECYGGPGPRLEESLAGFDGRCAVSVPPLTAALYGSADG